MPPQMHSCGNMIALIKYLFVCSLYVTLYCFCFVCCIMLFLLCTLPVIHGGHCCFGALALLVAAFCLYVTCSCMPHNASAGHLWPWVPWARTQQRLPTFGGNGLQTSRSSRILLDAISFPLSSLCRFYSAFTNLICLS